MSETDNQIIMSDVLSKSLVEEQASFPITHWQSSESGGPAAAEDNDGETEDAIESENNYQLMIIPKHETDYDCKYCEKTFSNKQALGGHQNAHKLERAMENLQEAGGIGFFGSHAGVSMAAAAHPGFLRRPLYNWNFTSRQMAGGGGMVHCNPPHGFNNCRYHPHPSAPRLSGFPFRPHYNQPINIQLANFGPGSSNAFRSGSDQGFAIRPGGNTSPAAPINLRNVPEVEHDETDLDLSLRLGYDNV